MKSRIFNLVILQCLLLGISMNIRADTLAASHGPIGVMADHTHHKGEWMLSYRFMHMDMKGKYTSSRRVFRR